MTRVTTGLALSVAAFAAAFLVLAGIPLGSASVAGGGAGTKSPGDVVLTLDDETPASGLGWYCPELAADPAADRAAAS
jgi:hypothetical protein